MTPKLNDAGAIRAALRQDPAKPLRIEDDETQRVYVLVDEQALPTLWDEYIRREVQRGVDELDRGEGVPLDIEATIAEARRRHAARDG